MAYAIGNAHGSFPQMPLDNRCHVVGATLEAEVGEVYAVHGALVVGTYHVSGRDEKHFLVAARTEFLEKLLQRGVLLVDGLPSLRVESCRWEYRVLHKEYWRVGVCLAQDGVEAFYLLVYQVARAVWQHVHDVKSCVVASHYLSDLRVELAIAAEPEIHHHAVEPALHDVCRRHAWP